MPRTLPLFLLVFFAGLSASFAQRRLDCPRPVREKASNTYPKPSLEIGAGLSRPLMYYNAGGEIGSSHRFISRLTPYATALVFFRVNERLELYGGAGVTQIWQGLRFEYNDASGALQINSYAGSMLFSLPIGLRYQAGNRLRLSAGPYIAYAAHTGQRESGGGSVITGSRSYTYTAPDDKGLNFGLRLGADIFITRRFALALICAADGRRSAPASARAEIGSRNPQIFEASLSPLLLHAGFGLSYRVFQGAE